MKFPFSAHFVFESLAYTIGFHIYRRSRRTAGDFLPGSARISVLAAALIGAAVGSRVLNWFEDPALTLRHWYDLPYLISGKTVVGALLGGTMLVELVKSRMGITRRTGDLFAIPLVIAIAIGRIGCFFEGLPDHTYGIATSLPWGVDFGDGILRHPTQLYESVFMILLALFLRWVGKRPHREGDLYRIFLVVYLFFRILIDFLKPGVRLGPMTGIQWACATGILAYWRDVRYLLARGRSRPTWAHESDLISSTTLRPPSAPSAIADATPRSSSRTETSTY